MSFSSGLAAIDVLLRATMRPGDSILIGNDVYGGTYRLLSKVFVPWGVELDVVDTTDVAALNAAPVPNRIGMYGWRRHRTRCLASPTSH